MTLDVVPATHTIEVFAGHPFPAVILNAGPSATRRFIEFFTAEIRNPNTRAAYATAVAQFLTWCEGRSISLPSLSPFLIASYIEQLGIGEERLSAPSIKQHLAGIKMLLDYLVIGQILPQNPAASVRGPKYVSKKGKTPVLSAADARHLLNSIPLSRKGGAPDLVGLRDRALIGLMVFSFARIGAACRMLVEDYYQNGKRCWFRLHEKGGKWHELPAHHSAESYLDAYLAAAGISSAKKSPLFRSAVGRTNQLSELGMSRTDALRMVKRRVKTAGLPDSICCHTFRATGITAYLSAGGTIEKAQLIAAHESPRTTKLYDRTNDQITLDEIERITI
jgi:integrase/recombinase XerD